MQFLLQLTRGIAAIALAASLAACGDSAQGWVTNAAPQGQVIANDCRSPGAQTTQRGCKPAARTFAKR